uniref:Uncharacterized protein n=1 Tax=Rhizophora mucronata TaxID=61149 RepID=A0A2P2R0N7_RHIMU
MLFYQPSLANNHFCLFQIYRRSRVCVYSKQFYKKIIIPICWVSVYFHAYFGCWIMEIISCHHFSDCMIRMVNDLLTICSFLGLRYRIGFPSI